MQNLDISGDFTVAGTFTFGDAATDNLVVKGKMTFPVGSARVPIQFGTKSNTVGSGLPLVGATDNTGGIMAFFDDGNAALAEITAPIWTRYLLLHDQTSGSTMTGAYFQTKTYNTISFTGGSITATKCFLQSTATTLLTGAEYAVINAGVSFEGNLVNTSGRFSGIDVNINTSAYTITDTAADSAGIHIRKVSSSTYGWPVGLKINDAGAITGIQLGTMTTGISLSGAYTTAISITGTSTTAISVADGYITLVKTQTSATPGSVRAIYGKNVMNATMTSGNLVGVRGEANIPNSGAASSAAFIYGVQGKLIGGSSGGISSTSIDVGSSHVCGVLGQLDLSNCTTTSGHIACLIASIQDTTSTARTQVNGIYVELPTYGSGAKMNSVLQGNGGATYYLDMGGANADYLVCMPATGLTPYSAGTGSAGAGKIKILVGSTPHYINTYTS